MLRITIHEAPAAVTLQLEGRLVGPWVLEAHQCWQRTRGHAPGSMFRVDLTAVTAIDAAGRRFLTEAHHQGANLIAAGCLIRAIVAEVTGAGRFREIPAMPTTEK